jgi:deoxyhypusine synthase
MDRHLHDGRSDGLVPLESMDLKHVSSFSDLLRAMSKTAFSGRSLGEAFEILIEMARNPDVRVVLTLSGAMTVAKQGRIICELIDRGLVHCLISTGALMAHGLTESIGLTHYKADPTKDDETLFHQGYNRIYDTYEMEANLNDVERVVRSVLDSVTPEDGVWSSSRLCRELGRELDQMDQGPGILRSAFQHQIPVFIPAFTDSEVGLDVATWAMQRWVKQQQLDPQRLSADEVMRVAPSFNPFYDLLEYARFAASAKTLGILTIGGGVPRNWAQQVAPFYDITNHRVGTKLPAPRFTYGVRICPEPSHWGGLSGCTYSEGVSWGKFVPPRDGGRFAEVYADATVAWPVLMKAVFEELDD